MKKNLYIDHSQIKGKNFKVLLDDYLVKSSETISKYRSLKKYLPPTFVNLYLISQALKIKLLNLTNKIT